MSKVLTSYSYQPYIQTTISYMKILNDKILMNCKDYVNVFPVEILHHDR